jgi:hypothetical protein
VIDVDETERTEIAAAPHEHVRQRGGIEAPAERDDDRRLRTRGGEKGVDHAFGKRPR